MFKLDGARIDTNLYKVLMETLMFGLIKLYEKMLLTVNMRSDIFWNWPGFNLDRDGNVLGHLVQTLQTQSELLPVDNRGFISMCNGPLLAATRSLRTVIGKCIYTGNVPTPLPPITSPLSLVVVWSGVHGAVVFMSGPGICQPWSCT